MKNLKKIAALVIVLAMALSTVSFAAFTDVAEDASYNEAVTVMAALDLLKGYEDGSFGPDKTITRAEFAAVVVRMLGMEDAAAGAAAATNFTDVPASHWAAGYVKIANQKEIIAGYGDGTFGPDDEVTYEQAIKMLVCALGYAPMFADVEDAYPTAYMAQANTLGMTIGAVGKIGDKATRAIVARLAYNALDDKLMQQTGFGTDKKFEAVNKTLLSEYLKVAKVEATVAPVSFKAEDADKLSVYISKFENGTNQVYEGVSFGASTTFDAVEGISYERGFNNIVYIDYLEGEDDAIVKAVAPQTAKAEVLELNRDQLLSNVYVPYSVVCDGGVGCNHASCTISSEVQSKLTYYVTSKDESSKTETINLENHFQVYKNEDIPAVSNLTTLFSSLASGSLVITGMKLVDTDGNNSYDAGYYTYVASSYISQINTRNMKINGVDFDDEDIIVDLKNAEGKAIDFADIKVGDVMNKIESTDGSTSKYEVIISSNVVEGTVSEKDGTDAYIGGTEYPDMYGVVSGQSGKFYVDILGRIVYFERDASSSKFGVLMHIYNDTNGASESVKAIIYADGKFQTYDFAKSVVINGTVTSGVMTENTYTTTNLAVDESATADYTEYLKNSGTPVIIANRPIVVLYQTNSAGALNKLYSGTFINYVDGLNYIYTDANSSSEDVQYDAADNALGGDVIADDAAIITTSYDYNAFGTTDAKGLDPIESKFTTASASYFADEEYYSVAKITDSDNDDEVIFAFVIGASAKVGADGPIMYVTADPYAGQTADGDAYVTIKGYVDGQMTTIKVNEDSRIYDLNDTTEVTGASVAAVTTGSVQVKKGAMIQYNEGDYSSAVRVVLTDAQVAGINGSTLGTITVTGNVGGAKDDKVGYIYGGQIAEFTATQIKIAGGNSIKDNQDVVGVKVTLNSGAIDNVYGGYYTADAESNKAGYYDGTANGDYVVAYIYDNTILGWIIVDTDPSDDM